MMKHHRPLAARLRDTAWIRELDRQQNHHAELAERRRSELERKEREAALTAKYNRAI